MKIFNKKTINYISEINLNNIKNKILDVKIKAFNKHNMMEKIENVNIFCFLYSKDNIEKIIKQISKYENILKKTFWLNQEDIKSLYKFIKEKKENIKKNSKWKEIYFEFETKNKFKFWIFFYNPLSFKFKNNILLYKINRKNNIKNETNIKEKEFEILLRSWIMEIIYEQKEIFFWVDLELLDTIEILLKN